MMYKLVLILVVLVLAAVVVFGIVFLAQAGVLAQLGEAVDYKASHIGDWLNP